MPRVPFQYNETRFAKISEQDDYCFRCNRVLLSTNVFYNKDIQWAPGDGPPHTNPTTAVEKKENNQWMEDNLGRNSEDSLRWSDVGGYFSNNLDCTRMCLVLCEDCKLELLGPFMKYQDTSYGPGMYHLDRWERRDDVAVQQKWDARKQKRILSAALPSTACQTVLKKL